MHLKSNEFYTLVSTLLVGSDAEYCFGLFPVLAERRKQQSATLSGGEQQMLANSRALMSRPTLLLLDEPSLGLAPQGYWQHIYGRKLYDTEQDQVADQVIDLLERFYPGLRNDIEVVDVATPLSYERYTGNWMGSTCG